MAEKADLGIAWDGDADRCFFIDEDGEFVPGDFVTALLAEALLLKNPGAKILYDLRASRAVPDVITANGGVPLLNRVGHAFFKQRMRREGGLFGGEVSGHYYFADNYNADSGFIPALLILELLSQKKATMAELLRAAAHQVLHQRRDQLCRGGRPGGARPHRTALRRRRAEPRGRHLGGLRATGTSTCAPPTPSHSCASTSAPTRRRSWRRSATSSSPSSARPDVEALTDLGPARVEEIDTAGMFAEVAGLPRQLRQGYESARRRLAGAFFGTFPAVPPAEPTAVVVCGMGGSAIGADLVLACLPALAVPAAVVRGYTLPEWVNPETLVIVVSYSGQTEESLACAAQARERGCAPVCVASGGGLAAFAEAEGLPLVVVPGGGQPRAAVGSLSMPLLATLEAAGLCHEHASDVAAAAAQLEADDAMLRPECPDDENPAKSLARRLENRLAVVYGAGPTGPGRAALEGADQRERQGSGLLQRASGARPQRAHGLDEPAGT